MRDNPELEGKDLGETMRKKMCTGYIYTELSSLECIAKIITGDSGISGVGRVVYEHLSTESGQLLRVA